eukprot:TRINITY_DN4612_c0_g1_i1.p1 TRINITY_DN4612_c0_g1~~TRINITY_DN4612_c0_g1_i1.p1  ORF type:complete len:931 (+),score=189.66 TRINITY_DN4612_c0_g1_i1:75-2867(+)
MALTASRAALAGTAVIQRPVHHGPGSATSVQASPAAVQVREAMAAPSASARSHGDLHEYIEGRGIRYLKGKLLGKGGFAKCFEVRELHTGNLYAAKIVAKSSITKPRAHEKLRSEIAIHRSLDMDKIVKFYDYFEDAENVYIILELCPNHTLNEFMRRRPGKRLSEAEAQFYIYDLISALKYLRRRRVIHRDLKLGNLFLDADGRIKIGDFGLAAQLEHDSQKQRTICGTPNYIAPEILDNRHGHSFEVDVWSLGVIIYTMLFGRPPFETQDVKTTYKRIRYNQYSFPPDINVSEQAKDLIGNVLRTDPRARPSLDEILASPWFADAQQGPPRVPSAVSQIAAASPRPHTARSETPERGVPDFARIDSPAPHHYAHRDQSPGAPTPQYSNTGLGGATPMRKQQIKADVFTPGRSPQVGRPPVLQRGNKENVVPRYTPMSPAINNGQAGTPLQAGIDKRQFEPMEPATATDGAVAAVPEKSASARSVKAYDSGRPEASRPLATSNGALRTRQLSTNTMPVAPARGRYAPVSPAVNHGQAGTPMATPQRIGVDRRPFEQPMEPLTPTDAAGQGMQEKSASARSFKAFDSARQDSARVLTTNNGASSSRQLSASGAPPAARGRYTPMSPVVTNGQAATPIATPQQIMVDKRQFDLPPEPLTPIGIGGAVAAAVPEKSASARSVMAFDSARQDSSRGLTANNGSSSSRQLPTNTATALPAGTAPELWVTKWVDYSSKYGVGYMLSDGSLGVYFNDSTKIVLAGRTFDYITRRTQEKPEQRNTYTFEDYPEDLKKKVTLLRHFKNYMTADSLERRDGATTGDTALPADLQSKVMPCNDSQGATYVKKWTRSRNAILFQLSNKVVQVMFFDKTEAVLSSKSHTVAYVDKKGELLGYPLSSALDVPNVELSKRLRYTRDILANLLGARNADFAAASG